MALFIRAKRVSDPLADEVRARLTSPEYSSGGSDHNATDPSFFSSLLHAFLDIDDHSESAHSGEDSDSEQNKVEDWYTEIADNVCALMDPSAKENGLRRRIIAQVAEAAKMLAELRSNKSAYKRAMMARLRDLGYNAGLCKSKWDRSGGLPGGDHEYVDIVAPLPSGEEMRYIVEVDFAGEFEIARATVGYERVVKALPELAVTTADEVKQVVRKVTEAGRRSMRTQELHVPPWRKNRYMKAKWLGPYRRTVNAEPTSASEVKCRAVGFRPAPGIIATPPAAAYGLRQLRAS